MTSIDELFKKPNAPLNKRKLEVNHDANGVYKASKLSQSGDVKHDKQATVEQDVDDDDDDVEAGPELPPEDEVLPDDADGRFFGGGVSKNTTQALNYIDEQGQGDRPEVIDAQWLRKTALSFERKISKNAELRAKFDSDPQKFMGSEADLDAEIKTLSNLAEHPELYEDFTKLGCVDSLVSLLSHENTDIAIDAIEIINELTDEDVNAEQEQWDVLVDALLEANLLSLLYENIQRMDEALESDRTGIYYILEVLENLSSRPSIVLEVGLNTKIMEWLLSRIQVQERPVSQNKQYAAEILAIFLQTSPENRKSFISQNGVDVLLQLLSPYRRKDPAKGTEEEEYVENLFDCLACCVDDLEGKNSFIESEGIELCLIMLREGKMSKERALRVLDHCLSGPDAAIASVKLVEAAGLKSVFGLFIKKQDGETVEHLLGIFASLLRYLPANSAERFRLQAKFAEKEWKLLGPLTKVRKEVAAKVAQVESDIKTEQADLPPEGRDEMVDEWLSRRMDAGLFVLQTVDIVLAWLVAENTEAKEAIERTLKQKGLSLSDVKNTLKDQLATMAEDSTKQDPDLEDMISTLIGFV